MKELGKYLVLMALMILMPGMLVIDALAQVTLVDVSYEFTGEKTRIVIDLSQPAQYSVIEDWDNNTISVLLPEVADANPKRFKLNELSNYIINRVELTNAGKGLELNITTTNDFKIKCFTLDTKRKLYLDVYLAIQKPDVKTLLHRGNAYELRGEYAKAVKQYEKALALKPGDEKVLLQLRNATHLLSQSYPPEADPPLADNEVQRNKNTDNVLSSVVTNNDLAGLIREGDTSRENDINGDNNQNHTAPSAAMTGTQPAEASNNDKSGMMIGLQELLRKSGTEIYVLVGLYIIVGFLAFIVFMLARKLIKLYKLSNRQKKIRGKLYVSDRPFLQSSRSNKGKLINEKHIKDVKRFARKLSELYAKTESLNQQTPSQTERYPPLRERREKVPFVEEHTQKIEAALKETDRLPYDSESISLTKKFRENNVTQNSSGEKYEAVRQLAEQNWEIWEIARELSMSTEEVKIALGFDAKEGKSSTKEALYERIYRMADKMLSPSDIAGKLHIGEEEVRLALKLRKTHAA